MTTSTPTIKYGIGEGCMNGHIKGDRNRIADSPIGVLINETF